MKKKVLKWCLQMAHDDLERAKDEVDEACARAKWCAESSLEDQTKRQAAQKEVTALRAERDTARDERDALRAELEAIKAKQVNGWVNVGLVWAHPDGRRVEPALGRGGEIVAAQDTRWVQQGHTVIEAARRAGWLDFPGAEK